MSNNGNNVSINTMQTITVDAVVSDNPQLVYMQSGKALVKIRIGDKRVFQRGTPQERTEWINYNVVVFENERSTFNMPEYLNKTLRKGMGITVRGTLKAQAYIRQTGEPGLSLEINASGFGGITLSPFVLSDGQQQSTDNSHDPYAPPSGDMDDVPF